MNRLIWDFSIMPSLAFQYNPSVGPLIQVGIASPALALRTQSQEVGNTSPGAVIYNALIDTGASCTCITAKVVNEVGLAPTGKQTVGGVHGKKVVNQYRFRVAILFPGPATITFPANAGPMAIPVLGVEFEWSGGFDVLLGRDILCQGVMTLSFDGHGTFSL
jgi:predicted aspartyl protease